MIQHILISSATALNFSGVLLTRTIFNPSFANCKKSQIFKLFFTILFQLKIYYYLPREKKPFLYHL